MPKYPRRVVLVKANQFGPDGPQIADRGICTGKFFIPGMDAAWYHVVFDYEDYSCPASAIVFLDD
jgi:hypothetical protein